MYVKSPVRHSVAAITTSDQKLYLKPGNKNGGE